MTVCKEEMWKPVKGYEGLYEISSYGNVKSLNYNHTKSIRAIRRYYHNSGYLAVDLWKNRKEKRYFVHRLVAENFIENPNNYNIVNHIDGNRLNNYFENLEWCTQQHNVKEAFRLGRRGSFLGKFGEKHNRSKPVLQLDLEGNFIKQWSCGNEIQRKLGFSNSNINACCLGKRKTAYGYKWQYET